MPSQGALARRVSSTLPPSATIALAHGFAFAQCGVPQPGQVTGGRVGSAAAHAEQNLTIGT
jgi:hypothetical protein